MKKKAKYIIKSYYKNKEYVYTYPVLLRTWRGIKSRCKGSHNKDYGARGIKCEWETYEEFYRDMSPGYKEGLTVDRIDVNGNYCKNNCRWASYKEQQRNTRKNLMFNGEFATDAVRRLGGATGLINMRLRYGWSIEKAFTEPVKNK